MLTECPISYNLWSMVDFSFAFYIVKAKGTSVILHYNTVV